MNQINSNNTGDEEKIDMSIQKELEPQVNASQVNASQINELSIEEPQEEVVQMNVFAKIVGIIFSPLKTLEAIKAKPTLLIVMLVICIIPMISIFLTWSSYETELIMQLEQQFETMNLEVTQEMMDFQLMITKFSLPIGIVFGMLFAGLLSGVYYFVCAKIAKSEVRFKQLISMAYHILVVGSISYILNIVLTLVGVDINMNVPITSLASLLPESFAGTFLYGAALAIEVFSLWGVVLAFYGLRIIAQMSKKAALISVMISFIFGLVFSGGSIMLASLFTNIRG